MTDTNPWDDEDGRAMGEALRALAQELDPRPPSEAYGGGSWRLNLFQAGKFVYHLIRFKAAVVVVDPEPLKVTTHAFEAITTGLNMLRQKLTESQFVVLCMLAKQPEGLTLSELTPQYPGFVKNWSDANVLARFWGLGVTKDYLRRAQVHGDERGIRHAVDELRKIGYVIEDGGRLHPRERYFEFGLP